MALALLIGLYLTSHYNYLLFHSLAEIFSIVIACGLFMIAWNARRLIESPMLVHLGIAYLFIAFLDLMHTLAYKGMHIFTDYDYYANQLWIATRYLEAATLLWFALRLQSQNRRFICTYTIYAAATTLIIVSIFIIPVFPVCYVEGTGLTPFKIISEYIISGILAITLLIFHRRRSFFSAQLFRLLFWSIAATIGSEIAFTFYIDNYGFSNLVGHYLKIVSFYLLYRSLVAEGLRNPVQLFYSRLQRTARELESANQTKNRIFSIIGHDLKNSFNSTIGITDLILAKSHRIDMAGKEGLELIRMINSSAKSTHELLENLLAWAQNESGRLSLHRETIEVASLFDKILRHHHLPAQEKEVRITSEISPQGLRAEGDTNMIQTALRNLIGNALKFTPRGGEVRLAARAEGNEVLFEVVDTGVGIEPERLEKLLDPEGIDTTRGTESEKGTGLGLKITREFIEKNGGTLAVESTPGEGSRFSFRLPAAPAPA